MITLRAHWHKLILINYIIDPAVLTGFTPAFTELDEHRGVHYLSLVGFLFSKSTLNGIPIPFHASFEEVNLRLYVRHTFENEIRHGVAFIKEIVPKPAVTFVANHFYKEHYESLPMKHQWDLQPDVQQIHYGWKKQNWNTIQITSNTIPEIPQPGSAELFLVDHFWGYAQKDPLITYEYHVAHSPWKIYRTLDYSLDVNFEKFYGQAFAFLRHQKPESVFLAEGSEIILRPSRKLTSE